MKQFLSIVVSTFMLFSSINAQRTTVDMQQIQENKLPITITFNLKPHELLYADSLSISIDNPDIRASEFQSDVQPIERYDERSKRTKKGYEGTFTLRGTAQIQNPSSLNRARLHIMYYVNTDQKPMHEIVPLMPSQSAEHGSKTPTNSQTDDTLSSNQIIDPEEKEAEWSVWSLSNSLSSLIRHTNSMLFRLLVVFLLGVLLSLTPCIYPMIPITVGILQAQRSSSFIYNFFLAASYTTGLATTFAIFGLIAGNIGPACGKLLVNPLVVIIIIALLLYLAFSMFGWYELYIPRFLQSSQRKSGNGSLASAFIFGVASGTIASPCVSPGLALILTVVATMGNPILGFLLLFVFGIGLSTPLLIVGTISNSLILLPKAGMWMVEIKKLFGLLLIGVCFYYLSNIVSFTTLLLLIATSCALFGFYCIIQSIRKPTLAALNLLLGIAALAGSIVILVQVYKERYCIIPTTIAWFSNESYEEAVTMARAQNKKLFIDFWATYCSICKTINKTVLADAAVINELNNYVIVKIDGTDETTQPYKTLKEQFEITGFPTLVVVDPANNTIIKRWSSEVYSMPRTQFIKELKTARS